MRDMFLSNTGLNQVTEMIYLDSTRPWALKAFETLILSGSEHQIDAAIHRLGKAEDQESEGTGDGPQSLSKFYEDLKEACLNWRSKSSVSAGIRWNHGGAYLNIINLFLCVAFLCVSKEADCNSDSENDLEDTSGTRLGGRLHFLLPDSMALSSKEQVRRAADVWSICHWLYLESPVFQRQLFRLGGLNVCCHLMTMVLQNLTSKTKEVKSAIMVGTHVPQQQDLNNAVNTRHMEVNSKVSANMLEEDWPLQSIRLLEALLSICLHSSKSMLQKPESSIPFQVVIMPFITKLFFIQTTQ